MKRKQAARVGLIGWAIGACLGFLLPGAGLADDGPIVCIDLQTSTTPDLGTITSTYTGSGPTVYAFLVVTEVPGDRVSGVSVGFDLSTDGSVTNTGFTLLTDWAASSEGAYGFDPEPSGSGETVPVAIGYWTLQLSEGSSSTGTLSLVPPGGVNGEAIVLVDGDRRGFAPAEARHAGINTAAPSTTTSDPLHEYLSARQHHVLMQPLGQNLVMPDGLIGAPLEALTQIDSSLSVAVASYGPARIDKVFPNSSPETDSLTYTWEGATVALPKLWKIFKISLGDTTDVTSLIDDLMDTQKVSFAEPNGLGEPSIEPDDAYFPDQWHLENDGSDTCKVVPFTWCTADADVDATDAWDITTGDPDVLVAIIDTGIYRDHDDLAGRTIIGDEEWGCDCYPGRLSHGTQVAGVLAAVTDNEDGVAGVDWSCTLMNQCVDYTEEVTAQAIKDAADAGADIINTSFEFQFWPNSTPYECLRQAVYYAFLKGTIPVSANGNKPHNFPRYPASWDPIVLAVGNNTCCDGLSGTFHNGWLDVVAPGTNILTTGTGVENLDCASTPVSNDYPIVSGSSFSCPIASGITSLILALRPRLSDRDTHRIIELTAVDLGDPGYDDVYAWGRVNATNALDYVENNTIYSVVVDPSEVEEVGSPSDWMTVTWDHPPDPYPPGDYSCRRHEMQAQDLTYPFSFTSTPDIWVRVGGTVGADDATYQQYDVPWGEVVDTTSSGCDLRTYIYEVDVGELDPAWWPATREEARFVYTVAGEATSPAGVEGDASPVADDQLALQCVAHADETLQLRLRAPRGGHGKIVMFNAEGREVRTIFEGRFAGGQSLIRRSLHGGSGSALPSGVYFVRWSVDGVGTATSKLVVVR